MPKKFRPIDIEEVKKLLDYDPESGKFTWKVARHNRRKAGDPACTAINSNGYYIVRLNNTLYRAHRLAWALYHGEDLGNIEIDHINGDKLDNRISNLRLAPEGKNNRNIPKKPFNTSGHKGVCWHKKARKWAASITVGGQPLHLGLFEDKNEAIKKATEARNFFHGEFANHK